jgi:lipopolysaccharide/colanic/teichoic acid biosynthesis glycosyltransferase
MGLLMIDAGYLRVKRFADIVLCLFAAPLLVPILVLCALAVRLDSPGPVVFTQLRTGQHGRRFRMFKFRTMVTNAEELKEQLRHLSIVPAPDFKLLDDPRITRVGKILRATSLDELPQVINVLHGAMSFVGPRPTSFEPATYDLWHTVRLEVPPGITGLWQIEGRNETTFDERLRLDVAYIRRMSLGLDLAILFRTATAVVRRPGV